MSSAGRVLVTGCAGFIGSHLCEKLLDLGYVVVGVDAFTNYYSPKLKRHNIRNLLRNEKFKLVELDLSQSPIENLLHIVGKVDYIIHQAAQPGVRSSWGINFNAYIKHNVVATQKLLESVVRVKNVKNFVYASSSSVYGSQPTMPFKENMLPKPHSPYGVTKLAAEHLCITYSENYNVPIVILRYFTVYGPRQRPDMAFHKFIKNMLLNAPIEIYGDGNQKRDFTYVGDVVDAVIRAIEIEDATGEIINIGSSNPVRLLDVIKVLANMVGVEPNIVFRAKQKGEVEVTYADISKARSILKWSPKIPLEEGLRAQIKWMKKILDLNLV